MSVDPLSSLAFSVYSQKGIYALLLGSGVSREAAILPGWDMTLDLISKYAAAENDPTNTPEVWYQKRFCKDPDYAEVLKMLAGTPAARRQILNHYFEADAEEREKNPRAKMPTDAHRAIAQLVAKGYFKVILTTNFDRLMEQALTDVGAAPHVIMLDDGIKGRLPFTHSGPTVIKLHGDYQDTRLLNTPAELAKYSAAQKELLREVFDTYGLIVCGWSGDYDTALRAAITASKSWRFSFYWTGRGEPRGSGKTLVEFRKGVAVEIKSADQVFTELSERIKALESLSYVDTLSPKIATARVKTYIQDATHHIQLHDLLIAEAERVANLGGKETDSFLFEALNPDLKLEKVNMLGALSQSIVHMCATTAYWASEDLAISSLCPTLEKLAVPPSVSRRQDGPKAELYPAMLAFYSVGIACVLKEKYNLLKKITMGCVRKDRNPDEEEKLASLLNPAFVLCSEHFLGVPGHSSRPSPISWIVFKHLQEAFRQLGVSDIDYERAFDDLEIFLSLQCWLILRKREGWSGDEVPLSPGHFCTAEGKKRLELIAVQLSFNHGNWPPFACGLFGDNLDVVQNGIQRLVPYTRQSNILPAP